MKVPTFSLPIAYVIPLCLVFTACGNRGGEAGEGTRTQTAAPCGVAADQRGAYWLLLNEDERLISLEEDADESSAKSRVLRLYDAGTCELLDAHSLPAEGSSGSGYRLAEITFNTLSHLVAIRGDSRIFVYDMTAGELLPELTPRFGEGEQVAATRGTLRQLEVWEDYLVGYEEGRGAFVFDLNEPGMPRPILPHATYAEADGTAQTLFLLPSGQEYQALLPRYNQAEKTLELHPVFKEPRPLFPKLSARSADGRYVILKVSDVAQPRSEVVDLKTGERVELPEMYVRGNDDQILRWLRSR